MSLRFALDLARSPDSTDAYPTLARSSPQVGLKSPADPATPDVPNTTWPAWLQRGLDTDVLVSEVRETSRKPDEGRSRSPCCRKSHTPLTSHSPLRPVYDLIERCCSGGRKLGESLRALAPHSLSPATDDDNRRDLREEAQHPPGLAHDRQPECVALCNALRCTQSSTQSTADRFRARFPPSQSAATASTSRSSLAASRSATRSGRTWQMPSSAGGRSPSAHDPS